MSTSTIAQLVPPLQRARCSHGDITWRESGTGPALVLLHGIGSGAASWQGQFEGFGDRYRVLAWDAPGYGESAPLNELKPLGEHYAQAVAEWLEVAQVEQAIVVGHSLGAIVAAAFAARRPQAVSALVLASPARGYASASEEVRAAKYRERVDLVVQLGMQRLAATRSANLCAPGAAESVIERVRQNMARATPGGYLQAAHLLAHDDLMSHLANAQRPRAVLCGEHDRVTTPAVCEAIAQEAGVPFVRLPGVGHASYVEDAARFNQALNDCIATH
jgi:pimeloyl-ACP methyl ester carboxylesterase